MIPDMVLDTDVCYLLAARTEMWLRTKSWSGAHWAEMSKGEIWRSNDLHWSAPERIHRLRLFRLSLADGTTVSLCDCNGRPTSCR